MSRNETHPAVRIMLVAGAVALAAFTGANAVGRHDARAESMFILSVILALGAHVYAIAGGRAAWRVSRAVIARGWRVALSYRFQIITLLVQLVVFALLVVTLGRPVVTLLFGPIGSALSAYEVTNYVVFLMLGISFFPVLWAAYEVSGSRIRHEQMTGVFEALVATPAGVRTLPFAYLLSSLAASLSGLVGLLTVFHFMLPSGSLAITRPLALLSFVGILAPAVITLWGVGLVIGGLTTVFKAAGSASRMLRVLMIAFGGIYIPLVFLPPWGQVLARALPVSYAGEGVRGALAEGAYLTDMLPQLAVLIGFALVASVAGMFAFRRLLDRARRAGTLSGY